jgi:cell wall-associated NlpC family hydrolase
MPSGHSLSRQTGRIAVAGLLLFSLVAIAAAIDVHPATASGSSTGTAIVNYAANKAGVAYCDGGGGINGPSVGGSGSTCAKGVVGFDCMSLAQYAVYQATGFAIDSENSSGITDNVYEGPDWNGNGSMGTYVPAGNTVALDEQALSPGDVLLFGGYNQSSYAHSGIWVGNDQIWDASDSDVHTVSFEDLMSTYNNAYQGAMDYNALSLIKSPPSTSPPAPNPPTSATSNGYDLVGSDGGVFVFKGGFYGSLPGLGIHVDNISGIVTTAADNGYFLVGSDGGVFAFHAHFANSLPGLGVHVNNIVGIVPTIDDQGYFLVGSDGGVFSFNAPFEKSLPGIGVHVNDIVGIAATADDNGYWLVGSNGAVYAFGDAHYYGNAPPGAVAVTSTKDGKGYWIVGANGAVTPFGDAGNYGDLPSLGVNVNDVVGIVVSPDSRGYNLIGSDGGVFSFGDAVNKGSLPGLGIHVGNVIGAVPT